jgi:phage shock protein A
MSTVHSIRSSAARHAALVQGINELEDAQHSLERCAVQIADLRKQITRSTAALMRTVRATETHRAAHVERRGKWRSRFGSRTQTMQAERCCFLYFSNGV